MSPCTHPEKDCSESDYPERERDSNERKQPFVYIIMSRCMEVDECSYNVAT